MNIKEENQPEESGHEVSQPYAMISHLITKPAAISGCTSYFTSCCWASSSVSSASYS